jgi:DNA-binding transcriptional MerR regulator
VAEPVVQENTPEIPDKLYFRIGEVSRLAGIKPYVLRFWESEFPALGPKKSGTGHRLYRRKEVELVLEIKRLLYEKRYTIEGARKYLEGRPKPDGKRPQEVKGERGKTSQGELFPLPQMFEDIRKELAAILAILK